MPSLKGLFMKLPGFTIPEINLLPSQGICVLYENFLSYEVANDLFKLLLDQTEWKQLKIKIFGKELDQPRLTEWYGVEGYSYSGIRLEPNMMPPELCKLQEKLSEKCAYSFNSVLLNLYRNERDSMGWHSDDEKELGSNPTIASISLGAPRVFQIKHKTDKEKKYKLVLNHGSLLCMSGSMQHYWQHAVPKAHAQTGPRINLTFRQINNHLKI